MGGAWAAGRNSPQDAVGPPVRGVGWNLPADPRVGGTSFPFVPMRLSLAAVLCYALPLAGAACGPVADTTPTVSIEAPPSALAAPSAGVQPLAPAEMTAKMSDPNVVVLDVRTPEEFATGHVRGAQNLDVTGPDFAARIALLDPSKTYVLYCRSGTRSARAADQMQATGFGSLFNAGGFSDLKAAGVPSE